MDTVVSKPKFNAIAALAGALLVLPAIVIGMAHAAIPDAPIRWLNPSLWWPLIIGGIVAALLAARLRHAWSWLTSLVIGVVLAFLVLVISQMV